ncbi:MAG: hypothetical protein K0Q73_8540, partial [Paenibacillus sp.]|nr:hypothetical protein [Paenibacillus sp.]
EEVKEYSHCLLCRRKLKNPTYRLTGIGPKCQKNYRKKRSEKVVQIEMF